MLLSFECVDVPSKEIVRIGKTVKGSFLLVVRAWIARFRDDEYAIDAFIEPIRSRSLRRGLRTCSSDRSLKDVGVESDIHLLMPTGSDHILRV
jgi:hypothetical protein